MAQHFARGIFSERFRVHGALCCVSLVFGAYNVVAKATLHEVPPAFLALVCTGGAALFLQVLARLRGGGRIGQGKAAYATLALYGLLCVCLTQLLLLLGLDTPLR